MILVIMKWCSQNIKMFKALFKPQIKPTTLLFAPLKLYQSAGNSTNNDLFIIGSVIFEIHRSATTLKPPASCCFGSSCAAKTSVTCRDEDTGSLGVSCAVWHQKVGSRCFGSCGVFGGAEPQWTRPVLTRPADAWSCWGVWRLLNMFNQLFLCSFCGVGRHIVLPREGGGHWHEGLLGLQQYLGCKDSSFPCKLLHRNKMINLINFRRRWFNRRLVGESFMFFLSWVQQKFPSNAAESVSE